MPAFAKQFWLPIILLIIFFFHWFGWIVILPFPRSHTLVKIYSSYLPRKSLKIKEFSFGQMRIKDSRAERELFKMLLKRFPLKIKLDMALIPSTKLLSNAIQETEDRGNFICFFLLDRVSVNPLKVKYMQWTISFQYIYQGYLCSTFIWEIWYHISRI
jgi:hypothetical protein